MEKQLDLSLAAGYDLIVDKDRNLDSQIVCTYFSGTSDYYYDFTFWTGASMTVKNDSGTIVQSFSTDDGSIVLQTGGVFKLVKTSVEMNTVRAGQYNYDMYLENTIYEKRAFLRGRITYTQNISN